MQNNEIYENNGAYAIQSDRKPIKQIVDIETGEIDTLYQGDKIIREKQSKFLQENKCSFAKGKGFVKTFPDAIPRLFEELQKNDAVFVLKLIAYIDYDCSLKHERNYLTMQSMETLTGTSYSTIRKIIPRLVKKEILAKRATIYGKGEGYVVNPYIACKGTDIPIKVYYAFCFSAWSWKG